MLKYIITGSMFAFAIASPASAQDRVPAGAADQAPASAAVRAPFAGPHVEIITGYEMNNVTAPREPQGVVYGIGAGYDLPLGHIRLGIQVEAADSTSKTCVSNLITAGDQFCLRTGRDLYAGARLGTTIGTRTLIYAGLGYSNSRFTSHYDPGPGSGGGGGAANGDGVRGSVGAEFRLGGRSFIRAEYRYSLYESDLHKHQGVVGFGFRF